MKPYGDPRRRGAPLDPNQNDARRDYRILKRSQRKRARKAAQEEAQREARETLETLEDKMPSEEVPSALQSSLEGLLARYPRVDPVLWEEPPVVQAAKGRWRERALKEAAFVSSFLDESPLDWSDAIIDEIVDALMALEVTLIGFSVQKDPLPGPSGPYLEVRAHDPEHRYEALRQIVVGGVAVPVRVVHVPEDQRFTLL